MRYQVRLEHDGRELDEAETYEEAEKLIAEYYEDDAKQFGDECIFGGYQEEDKFVNAFRDEFYPKPDRRDYDAYEDYHEAICQQDEAWYSFLSEGKLTDEQREWVNDNYRYYHEHSYEIYDTVEEEIV